MKQKKLIRRKDKRTCCIDWHHRILTGLRMLRPCEVTVYTPDQFLVTTINEGNMDKWKREEWRRPHGKEIKNKELWQELSEQMEKHRVTLEFSESTRYSDRLQSKMR